MTDCESNCKCPACGYSFVVVKTFHGPETEECDNGLKVTYRATLDMPRFCPMCKHDFDRDFADAVKENVRRLDA